MSLAEWPHSVTSMIVPPARTSGGGGARLGGAFCTAMANVPAAKDRAAVQTNGFWRNSRSGRRINPEISLWDCRSGNKRGNSCLTDGIVRVFPILLHGGWANEAA